MVGKFALAAVLCLVQGAVRAADLPAYPFVHVQGQGIAYAVPDVGEIEFEVSAIDADPRQARALVEERLAAVQALVTTHGVTQDNVTVRDVRRDMPKGEAAAPAYHLKANVRIKVTTITSWKEVVLGLLSMPHLDDFSVAFDVSNRAQVESELMADAIRNARKKAVGMAAGLGRKLGPAGGVSMGELRNLSRAMGLASSDFQTHRPASDVSSDRASLVTINVIRMGQSVDVLYQLK